MQTPPGPPPSPEMAYNAWGPCVTQLVNALSKGLERQAAAYNIVAVEFILLRVFLEMETCTVSDLSRALPFDSPRISRMVFKLSEQGIIERNRDRQDRRIVWLTLTEDGRRMMDDITRRMAAYDAELLEGISPEELAAFLSTAQKILANFQAKEQTQQE